MKGNKKEEEAWLPSRVKLRFLMCHFFPFFLLCLLIRYFAIQYTICSALYTDAVHRKKTWRNRFDKILWHITYIHRAIVCFLFHFLLPRNGFFFARHDFARSMYGYCFGNLYKLQLWSMIFHGDEKK